MVAGSGEAGTWVWGKRGSRHVPGMAGVVAGTGEGCPEDLGSPVGV